MAVLLARVRQQPGQSFDLIARPTIGIRSILLNFWSFDDVTYRGWTVSDDFHLNCHESSLIEIRWEPPLPRRTKLDTDGSVSGNLGRTGSGGVIRGGGVGGQDLRARSPHWQGPRLSFGLQGMD